MNILQSKQNKSQQGFVALFTVLLATVILAMAVGMSNITYKQLILSAAATEGNISFLVADSGVECALANDPVLVVGATNPIVSCNGVSYPVGSANNGQFSFAIGYGENDAYCAFITVDKIVSAPLRGRIVSTGVNAPCTAAVTPRTVEREIEVEY